MTFLISLRRFSAPILVLGLACGAAWCEDSNAAQRAATPGVAAVPGASVSGAATAAPVDARPPGVKARAASPGIDAAGVASAAPGADGPAAPAFLYNTLGQPWQATDAGRFDWEATLGLAGSSSLPGSIDAGAAGLLLSARTGFCSWADGGLVAGPAAAKVEDSPSASSWLGGLTLHAAADLGAGHGLAAYAAPLWTFDETGLAATSVTLTAVYGHEPDAGWSQDFNLAATYSDHGGFGAAQGPDLDNLWTYTALASLAHASADGLFGYSFEGFAAWSAGDFDSDVSGAQDRAGAWRLGAGIGCQKNTAIDARRMRAWALYAGFQWERADVPGDGVYDTPVLVVNLTLGAARAWRRGG